jgi:hypothetical protein
MIVVVSVMLVLMAVVGGVAIAGVWGHFWNFQVSGADSDTCGNCHVMENYLASQQNSAMLASFHASRDVTCTDCHARTFQNQLGETIAYVRDDYQEPLASVEYTMDDCFACHEHGSYDQIAWRTTDLGVTDAQAGGHSANPHQPPHFSNLECNTCHFVHQPQKLLCAECHSYDFAYP